ncbi:glycosyltransferase family 4 protein [Tautonia plasticadhaerens]|uniref:GDP-mannose-dependent alpha-mannosyltransferase n=1 Tax=Tautonia plasticadhaerens TaxID=2527974 RepID=A0A518GYJ2_9BACT|nr:glycosyltransferase family 1 protein [Tautonia plasticadhaerens]QDV33622.1 GDP-mannose-dependent alpha-mannosyltransferase [Tautonia plasticadhaerens]
MRITIVTETYVPQVNGVSRTLSQLVRTLEQGGDAVQVIHPDYGKPPDAARCHRVPSLRIPFYPDLHLPIPPYRGVRTAIDRFRPDLIHVATEATLGLAVHRYAARRRIPIVSSFHTNFDQYSDHYRVGWARGLIWRYLRWFHNRTLETYVPSRATMLGLQRRGFRNLVLWPRGVDASLFRPDRPGREAVRRSLGFEADDVVIAYVGRVAVEKNVDYLAEALAEVARRFPRARPLIIGDGPARPGLEERLGGLATFVGFRSGDELADSYAAADVFAFASRTETFGNVVLEAMASGLPAVVLAEGGPAEIVRHGETGLAIDPDSPPSTFAGAILALAEDGPLRRRLAAQARDHARSQSWEQIMGTLRGRYEAILGAGSPAVAPIG